MCQNQPRDLRGRYSSIRTSTVVPKSVGLSNLRNGSLYRVLGGPIARLRGATYGDHVVMSVHNKPLVVKRDRLRLADQEDVSAYLADSRDS